MGMFDGITDAISGATSAIGGMVDPIQGLVSGGLSALGGASANQATWDRQMASQNFNAAQSQAQMDFQKNMRATQYQTAVSDLMAAGLNPMLAYTQGGAGTPSGASAQSQAQPSHDVLTPATSAFQNARSTAADLILKKEQAVATTAQAEQSRTQALANTATALNQAEQSNMPQQQIANLQKTLSLISAQINQANAAAAASSAQAAKTKQETDLGIVSSNPITQFWGEAKRGAQWIHERFNPKMNDLLNRYDNRKKK